MTIPESLPSRILGDQQKMKTVLELTPAIAAGTNELPAGFPGDPFNRTIVATAGLLDLRLITADPAIRDARACAVEYYPFKPRRSRSKKTRPQS